LKQTNVTLLEYKEGDLFIQKEKESVFYEFVIYAEKDKTFNFLSKNHVLDSLDKNIFEGVEIDNRGMCLYKEAKHQDFDTKKIESYLESKEFDDLLAYLSISEIPVVEKELMDLEEIILDQGDMDIVRDQISRVMNAYIEEKYQSVREKKITDFLYENGAKTRLEICFELSLNRNQVIDTINSLVRKGKILTSGDKYIAK
jgi:hypothetical protein